MFTTIFDKTTRADWQKLKKKNPAFEQARPKDDLGPRMDRVVKFAAQYRAAVDQLDKMGLALLREIEAMEQTLDGYVNHVPVGMQTDFDSLQKKVSRTLTKFDDQRKVVRKAGEDMKIVLMSG